MKISGFTLLAILSMFAVINIVNAVAEPDQHHRV
ncbi:hypothetical protein MTO96_039299, partial [Rhipicephalus appendiculatus]